MDPARLSDPRAPGPGLTIIQVDGLSLPALRAAMERGRCERIRALVERRSHTLNSLYSGLPSTTPAVQGELFYGVRTGVPAFAYRRRSDGSPTHFMDPGPALRVERALAGRAGAGGSLLEGGAGYCNIYTGGAQEAIFCPAALADLNADLTRHPRIAARMIGAYLGVAARSMVMMGGETLRMLAGGPAADGAPLRARMGRAWDRITASVALRDISRLDALRSIRRGAPITMVNFIGYDKQAHRYGPLSRPAMRALAGADAAIGSLIDAGDQAGRGVVVFSDHGQESTTPLRRAVGAPIEDIVREAASDAPRDARPRDRRSLGEEARRATARLREEMGEALVGIHATDDGDGGPLTIQSGPIAHVYGLDHLDGEGRRRIGERVARRAPGVAVLWRRDDGGSGALLRDTAHESVGALCERLARDHPFRDRIADDLGALCAHEDAGDLVLLSTGFADQAMTFADELGSHGGPGPVETHAFVIAERSLGLTGDGRAAPRPLDLRRAILTGEPR